MIKYYTNDSLKLEFIFKYRLMIFFAVWITFNDNAQSK